MFWEELNVNAFAEAPERCGKVCIFPIGCLEKHGNHLPLGTDIYTAREIAARAAKEEEVMIFPSYPLGFVTEVKHKAGTVALHYQLQLQVLEAIFEEISRNGFKKILILNGHGGNCPFLQAFGRSMLEKKRDYFVYVYDAYHLRPEQDEELNAKFGPVPEGGHADHKEKSQIMAIRPDLVHMELVNPEESKSLGRADWYAQRAVFSGIGWYESYPHQFAGDPSGATAEYGEEMLKLNAANVTEIIRKIKEDDVLPALYEEFCSDHAEPKI